MLEIEVKVRVADLRAVREALAGRGLLPVRERAREVNVLFDFRDRILTSRRQALRLRTAGRQSVLTFKGAPHKSRRFKVREEFETPVKDARELVKTLRALGLVETFRYEKRRTVYRKGTLTICLDELAIGNFLEVEGEREKIVRFLKALGMPQKDWIRKDYIQLIRDASGRPDGGYSSSFSPPTSPPSMSSS